MCANEPGSCIPQSNSTMPSPAATAHALQCGTPGHGSGSRSRQTPGTTRSPRPSSRLRSGAGMDAGTLSLELSAMPPRKTKAVQVAEAYFAAVTARDAEAMAAHWAPDGRDRIHGQADLEGPDAVRDYFTG